MPNKTIIIKNKKNQNFIDFSHFIKVNVTQEGSQKKILRDIYVIYDFFKYGVGIPKVSLSEIYDLNKKYSRKDFFLISHKYLKSLYALNYNKNSIATYIPSLRRIFLYLYPKQGMITNIFGIRRHDWIINKNDPAKISYILNQGFNANLEEILVKLFVSLTWELYFPIQDIIQIKIIQFYPLTFSIQFNTKNLKDSSTIYFSGNQRIKYLLFKYQRFLPLSCGLKLFPVNYNEQKIRILYDKFLLKYNIELLTFRDIKNLKLEQYLYKHRVLTIY